MKTPAGTSKIPVHLYGGVILFARDRRSFERAYKSLHDSNYPGDSEEGAGLTCREPVHKDGETYYLSGVFDGRLDTLCHETGHCATIIMKRAGINPHDDDGESFCYLQEYIFTEFYKRMFPKQKKEIPEYLTPHEW